MKRSFERYDASSERGGNMRRREFLGVFGGAALTWPLAARAQQPMRRVGALMAFAENDREGLVRVAPFREGLEKRGSAEGRNIRIETHWATADVLSIRRAAKDLVTLRPDLILSNSSPTTAALL